jgi:hypothetical protein
MTVVSANLKAGGAPELLSALLEGESLFNDASGLVSSGSGARADLHLLLDDVFGPYTYTRCSSIFFFGS